MGAYAFAVVALLLWILGFLLWAFYRSAMQVLRLDRRLDQWRRLAGVVRPEGSELAGLSVGESVSFARIMAGFVPVGPAERAKLTAVLRSAGFTGADVLAGLLCAKAACALLFAVSAIFVCSYAGLSVVVTAVLALGGLVLGSSLPEFVVRFIAAQHSATLSSSISDALDLMVMMVETGLPVERALSRVAIEMRTISPVLAAEFAQLDAELSLGVDRGRALTSFIDRARADGLRDLGLALLQSSRHGTPIAQSLRNVARSERAQNAMRITERVQRMPVLMVIPMMLFVIPGVGILLVGPAMMQALKALGSVA